MRQAALISDTHAARREAGHEARRALPMLGAQRDIRYYEVPSSGVLNDPESTGMAYWSINPYVGCAFGCAYCYARYAHRYASERLVAAAPHGDAFAADVAEMPPWLAFERRVLVKRAAPAVLRRELARLVARGALDGQTIVVGTATDPYQPAERRFRVTRGVLEALAECEGLSVVVITKSALVARDADVLARIGRRSRLSVHVSLITLDRSLARRLEPRAPTPEARLRAIARLAAAGVDVGVNLMPVLPGITDDPAGLAALVGRAAAAGASHVNAGALELRSGTRERYLPLVAREFPHLVARYRGAYAVGHKPGTRYRAGLRRVVARLCREAGIRFGRPDDDRVWRRLHGEREIAGDVARDDDGGAGDAGDAARRPVQGPQLALAFALSHTLASPKADARARTRVGDHS